MSEALTEASIVEGLIERLTKGPELACGCAANGQLIYMAERIQDAITGLKNAETNRNPRIARIECIAFVHVSWFYMLTCCTASNIISRKSLEGYATLITPFSDKILGKDFFEALDEYIEASDDVYFDESDQYDVMDMMMHALYDGFLILIQMVGMDCKSIKRAHHDFFNAMTSYVELRKHNKRKRAKEALLVHYERFVKAIGELTDRVAEFEKSLFRLRPKVDIRRLIVDDSNIEKLAQTMRAAYEGSPMAHQEERGENVVEDPRYEKFFIRLPVALNLIRTKFSFCEINRVLTEGFRLAQTLPLDSDFPFREGIRYALLSILGCRSRDSGFKFNELTEPDLRECYLSLRLVITEMSRFVDEVVHEYEIRGVEMQDVDDFYKHGPKLLGKLLATKPENRESELEWIENVTVAFMLLAQQCGEVRLCHDKINVWISKKYNNEDVSDDALEEMADNIMKARQTNRKSVIQHAYEKAYMLLENSLGKNDVDQKIENLIEVARKHLFLVEPLDGSKVKYILDEIAALIDEAVTGMKNGRPQIIKPQFDWLQCLPVVLTFPDSEEDDSQDEPVSIPCKWALVLNKIESNVMAYLDAGIALSRRLGVSGSLELPEAKIILTNEFTKVKEQRDIGKIEKAVSLIAGVANHMAVECEPTPPSKTIGVLERTYAFVDNAINHPAEKPCLFANADFRQTLGELWHHQSDADYCISQNDYSRAEELWMNTRHRLIDYCKLLKQRDEIKSAIAGLKSQDSYFIAAPFDSPVLSMPHSLNGVLMKELYCLCGITDEEWKGNIRPEPKLVTQSQDNQDAGEPGDINWKGSSIQGSRLECTKGFSYVRDIKHNVDGHPVSSYGEFTGDALIALKVLVKAFHSKTNEGWVKAQIPSTDKDGKPKLINIRIALGRSPYKRFKNEQMRPGTRNDHFGYWRILTDDEFDDFSSIGRNRKRKMPMN